MTDLKKKKKKDLTQALRDASGSSVDPSAVHQSLIRNSLSGGVAVKKPFSRKGNNEKRLSMPDYTRLGPFLNHEHRKF